MSEQEKHELDAWTKAIAESFKACAKAARACAEEAREIRKFYTAKYACQKRARTIAQCKRKRLPAPKEK